MEQPKYIRDINGPVSAYDMSVFEKKVKSGIPHQDLIKFGTSGEGNEEDNCLYTIGKCVFPVNHRGVATNTRWAFIYVASGNMFLNHTMLEEGDWIFFPKGIIWTTATKSQECPTYYWCTSNDPYIDEAIKHFGFESEVVGGHGDKRNTVVAACERMIYNMHTNSNYRLLFMSSVLEILSCVAQPRVQQALPVGPLFEHMQHHVEYKGGRTTVTELAKKYYISRRYLYDIFMENVGQSPQDYILSEKMKTARKFVRHSTNSITQIAEYLQYSTYSHFSRAYFNYYGILPSEDRKQARKEEVMGKSEEVIGEEEE